MLILLVGRESRTMFTNDFILTIKYDSMMDIWTLLSGSVF